MLHPDVLSGPPRRLADRLAIADRRRFVGRAAEVELFRSVLVAADPPLAALHVHGPGGIGKSALLREWARVAAEISRGVILLDGHSVDPSPAAFLAALGTNEPELPRLAERSPFVLMIDTYERLAPLDEWLRTVLFPQLPDRSLAVLAGRVPPTPAWTADAGWGALTRVLPLRNLRPDESRALLADRDVPEATHESVLAFTHGHPLALSLVADVLLRSDQAADFRPHDAPDVVRTLLGQFVASVPSPRHRLALETSAHVRVTTEPLLAAVVGSEDAHELFAWLRGLSFVEQGPDGLYPHDVAREVLDVDFQWRDSDGYAEMHRRVWQHLKHRVRETSGRAQQRAFFDKLFLHRNHPTGRYHHHYASLGRFFAEQPTDGDHGVITEMVRRHEGEQSARVAAHWLGRQPNAFRVYRAPAGEVLGLVGALALHEATPEDLAIDPAAAAAVSFARARGPRSGDEIQYVRFHMERELYQLMSPTINILALSVTLAALRQSRLTWTLIAFSDPDQMAATMQYVEFARAREADFTSDGRRYGVFAHDWRIQPFDAWWDRASERSRGIEPEPAVVDVPVAAPLIVLSEPEFGAAVRQALRDFSRPKLLATNPLLRSRLSIEAAAGEPSPATLQTLLRDAAERVRTSARGEKFFRALHHTYLQPAASQERAAERLGLSFSTYRYHLARGTDLVIESLWERELNGPTE